MIPACRSAEPNCFSDLYTLIASSRYASLRDVPSVAVVFALLISACSSIPSVSDLSTLNNEESDWLKHSSTAATANVATGDTRLDVFTAEETLVPGPVYSVDAIKLAASVLLYSLAKEAELELVLDGEHSTPITLSVANKPIEYILDRLARQSPMRWSIHAGVLEIAPDKPYLKSYSVNYLNITRQTQSSVGLATQVGSINLNGTQEGSASGFSNNSQSLIENESRHQFWESLAHDLDAITQASSDENGTVLINRDNGLVTVRATDLRHQEIERYLAQIATISSRQVLIEATVVEVALSERFQAGIDWRALGGDGKGVNLAQVFHGQAPVNSSTINQTVRPSALLTAIHQSNSLGRITATLDLLHEFGDVKILSRPQIIAINNQSAVLKVVDNRVYFTMSVERQSREGGDDVTTATEIHTVPVGLVMSVTPYVGADKSVILNVRPTISRILGFVNDPNPELAAANVQNGVPEIQVREMESVLKVANGQIVMIGGLMQHQRGTEDAEVPWLGRIPGVGWAFKNRRRTARKTELLVFLQPTVLDGNDVVASADSESLQSPGKLPLSWTRQDNKNIK